MEKRAPLTNKSQTVRTIQISDTRLQTLDSLRLCGEVRRRRNIVLGKAYEFFGISGPIRLCELCSCDSLITEEKYV